MPRAEYKVVGQYPIEERDVDGYTTGRDAMPGEAVWLDDDEHILDIGGQRLPVRINVQALLMAGCVAPVEKAAGKPDPKGDKTGAGDKT